MTAHPIPLAALDDRLGFVGTAGSGKTYNAGSAIERVLGSGGRVIIPDPLGVWWGLGLSADGRAPALWREKGRLVIFGGQHGDLPLNEHAGALIGETVAGMAESAILDLSGFGTKASERRFMLAFLTAFNRHTNSEPVHLVFDEADMWAPQRLLDKEGEAAKLLGMMETVVRRGRIKGFIPWLITQRPAVLSKDVLSQVDGLVAFKLTSSQDRDALGGWIEGQADKAQGKEILGALPTLPRGTGVVWLPHRDVLTTAAFPLKVTFDSSRTPQRGEKVERRELKPLDLDRLKGKLASIEDETKANDPRALKDEIRRLNNALAKELRAKAAPPKPEIVHANAAEVEEARADGQRVGIAIGITRAQQALAALRVDEPKAGRRPIVEHHPREPHRREAPAPVVAQAGLTGPQQRILNAIAWWNAFGIEQPTNEQVGFVAGYAPGSGNFNNLKGGLRAAGLIDYPAGGKIALTESGADKADAPTIEPTRDAFHAAVRAKLKGPQVRLLDPAIAAHPDSIASDDVAAAAGYAPGSGNFNNLRGSLKSIGLFEYPSPGLVRAADWLFP